MAYEQNRMMGHEKSQIRNLGPQQIQVRNLILLGEITLTFMKWSIRDMNWFFHIMITGFIRKCNELALF